ncbi:MAG: 1,4-alpha-glucan branching protein GlgB [Acidimicrobiia bacterium]|nr:1,4-alpha-glucan branching protein GlgB [Acidimicrobiia bacterium]
MKKPAPIGNPVGEMDLHLFNEGTHRYLHRALGAHPAGNGVWFAVWAPAAAAVAVIGEMTGWDGEQALAPVGGSGIWSGFVDGATVGQSYRYAVVSAKGGRLEKSDPVGLATNEPPSTASVVTADGYEWGDDAWMDERGARVAPDAPISIYEVHLGSWGRHVTPGRRFARYDELADPIADHVLAHGFTHVELLPVMEHPFYGSWGYQTTGFFAPTARYGTPADLMAMVDRLHQRGVGVILDWVPSHFPMDDHGLARFDGTHLYEHADPRQGYHPDWTSAIFNYGRAEVRSFLVSSALSWLERFHVDGLRVDAVASMLYLDYSRCDGEWVPNRFGGRENLEAIDFLRQLNDAVHEEFLGAATFAEESTAWPRVTGPTGEGGLGFDFKWDMGWMHDTLQYLRRDPVHRRFHHDEITFRNMYAFTERYVLPLSHDEVVHGKGSLLTKMPGDDWQRFANVRLLFGMMWTQPGKKLLFMGGEVANPLEWAHEGAIDWAGLHDGPGHGGVRRLVTDLNALYAREPALHAGDTDPAGSYLTVGNDDTHSVFAWLRRDPTGAGAPVLCVVNATPTVHHGYRVGVPDGGTWVELLNTDADTYDGSGVGNLGGVETSDQPWHDFAQSIALTLPPLAVVLLQPG